MPRFQWEVGGLPPPSGTGWGGGHHPSWVPSAAGSGTRSGAKGVDSPWCNCTEVGRGR